MRKVMFHITLLLALFLAYTSANSQDDYRCKIERIAMSEGDSGKLYEMYKNAYVGKEFTVERRSGLTAGAVKNAYLTKPQIIDYGSKDNAYKVVTTMRVEEGVGYGSNVYYLNITEYVESLKKPFIFVENDKVYFGKCEHF